MKSMNSQLILNVEINDVDLISKLNIFSQELSISLEDIILYSLEKLIYDIEFVRKLRR